MLRNEMLSLPVNWEAILEHMMLTQPAGFKRESAYICSPCRADTAKDVIRNMKAARIYMFYAYIHLPGVPKAPHAYLPVLLDDNFEDDRALALRFGAELLADCKKMYVCGDRLSEGMYDEIKAAVKRKIQVQVFNYSAYYDLIPRLANDCISMQCVQHEDGHPHFALSMGADELAAYWEEGGSNAKLLPTG